jgi:Serine aminopeptidase, S33
MSVGLDLNSLEQAGYFKVPGAHLYAVRHECPDPLARVLLVGSFASERHTSYMPWARWARYLASHGIECLRYDYRGMGESTGDTDAMSFDDWCEDVEILAHWLDSQSPQVPLLIHGLEMGALLASKAFPATSAEALLLWAPPKSANDVLRPALQRRIAMDNMFRFGAERKKIADYIQHLETEPLEIDGYHWSQKLWNDSLQFQLEPCSKPSQTVALGPDAAPLVKGGLYISMNPDFTALFAENLAWIAAALGIKTGSCHAYCH